MAEYADQPEFKEIKTDQEILEHVSGAIGAGFFEFVIEDLRQCKKDGMSIVDVIVYAFERSEKALNSQGKSIALAVVLALIAGSDFDPKELRKLVTGDANVE